MDSDDADFQPGPSFESAVKQEKKVIFEPPIKKNRKKPTDGKSSFFKMKENKYLKNNNSGIVKPVSNNHKSRAVPSKQIKEKEISNNDNDSRWNDSSSNQNTLAAKFKAGLEQAGPARHPPDKRLVETERSGSSGGSQEKPQCGPSPRFPIANLPEHRSKKTYFNEEYQRQQQEETEPGKPGNQEQSMKGEEQQKRTGKREISNNGKKSNECFKVAKERFEVDDIRGEGKLDKHSIADLTSLDIRVKNMVKQVRREEDMSFSESSLDDSDDDPDFKAADPSESSTDESTTDESSTEEEEGELFSKRSPNALNQKQGSKHQKSEKSKKSKGMPQSPSTTLPIATPPAPQPDLSIDISVKQAISLKCNDCDKAYVNMGSLVKHMKVCRRSHICLKCNKKFRKLKYLKVHAKLQHCDYKYNCEKCELRFKSKSKLDRHEKLAHTTREVKCAICQRKFKNQPTLQVHRSKCHKKGKVVKKIWRSSMCPKTFQSDRGLRHHKIHHKNMNIINETTDVQDHGSET